MKLLRITSYVGLLLALVSTVACSHGLQSVISIQESTCQSCGAAVMRRLNKFTGVLESKYDLKTNEITVTHEKNIAPESLLAACDKGDYKCVLGAGKGSYVKGPTFGSKLDVKWLTHIGAAVDIRKHLVPEKITVVDFYADWCGPCRNVDVMMADYLEEHPDGVAYRKINIVDWDSPVAKKHLVGIAGLPYVRIYGRDKSLIVILENFTLEKLYKTLEKVRLGKKL